MPTADSAARLRTTRTVRPPLANTSLFKKTGGQVAVPRYSTASTSRTPVDSGGGSPYVGGYGGDDTSGGVATAAAAATPRVSLRDFIDQDFGYQQAQAEYGDNGRRIRDFDSETTRLRGETERDQEVRRQDLTQDLGEASIESAEDLAGRGILRSGGLFVEQDKINQEGNRRRAAIDDLLTDFLSQRGSGRLQQQQANRQALNEQINQLTQRYQSQYGI